MGNKRSRPPTKETGPDTNANHGPPSITGSCVETWVIREQELIDEAREARLMLWMALGLRVPCHDDDLVVARAQVAVDHALRKAAS